MHMLRDAWRMCIFWGSFLGLITLTADQAYNSDGAAADHERLLYLPLYFCLVLARAVRIWEGSFVPYQPTATSDQRAIAVCIAICLGAVIIQCPVRYGVVVAAAPRRPDHCSSDCTLERRPDQCSNRLKYNSIQGGRVSFRRDVGQVYLWRRWRRRDMRRQSMAQHGRRYMCHVSIQTTLCV